YAVYSSGDLLENFFKSSSVFCAFDASPYRQDRTTCPCCWWMADLMPPTTAAPTAAPHAPPATTAPRFAHLPKARVKRLPDSLPDSSDFCWTSPRYFLTSLPSPDVLGKIEI